MNKRCTNSSCRKTFSTLNYGGQCPFCGKAYSQLVSARKPVSSPCGQKAPFMRITISPKDESLGKRTSIDLSLKGTLRFFKTGQKVKAIRALREEGFRRGYYIGLREAKGVVDDLFGSRRPHALWRFNGEKRDWDGWKGQVWKGLKIIEPIFETTASQQPSASRKIPDRTLEQLDLSIRAYNALKRAGINTVADLVRMDEEGLTRVRNLGRKSQEEIKEKLRAMGLSLQEKKEPCGTADVFTLVEAPTEKNDPAKSTEQPSLDAPDNSFHFQPLIFDDLDIEPL